MKKNYSKPEIVFEDFSLCTSIAANCEFKNNGPSSNQCGYQPEGLPYTIFLTGMSGCARKYTDGGYNGICYHVPSEDSNLFNS